MQESLLVQDKQVAYSEEINNIFGYMALCTCCVLYVCVLELSTALNFFQTPSRHFFSVLLAFGVNFVMYYIPVSYTHLDVYKRQGL